MSPALTAASATVMRSRGWAWTDRVQGGQYAVLAHSRAWSR